MYAGEIVERAPVDELFANPQHPYTVGLLGSIPRLDRRAAHLATIEGMVPNMADAAARLPLRGALPVRRRSLPRRAAAAGRCSSARPLRRAASARAAGEAGVMTALLEVEGLVKHFVAGARCSAGRPRIVKAVDGVELHRRGRQDAGAGRRIRLRQVHRRPAGAAADRADRRQRPLRGPRPAARSTRNDTARVPPRRADHLPGPLRLAQSAHDGRARSWPSRWRCTTSCRRRAAASASPNCCGWSGSSRASRAAIRTNSPAASASASPSPARSRSSRS